ncbi:MAG: DNA methyltransferase [Bacillota bacterium]
MAYGLRVYLPSDHPYKGNEIGLEQHPNDYIKNLVEVSREIMRVLRKDGSYYLVLGDTYWGSAQGYGAKRKSPHGFQDVNDGFYASSFDKPPMLNKFPDKWLKPKQKMLMPYRVAIALQEDGWLCRNDITWFKRNSMPSSVKDRLTCTTERIFHFVKSRHYYYNLDVIRIPHSQSSIERYERAIEFGAKNREGSKASFNQYGFTDCDKRTGVPKSIQAIIEGQKVSIPPQTHGDGIVTVSKSFNLRVRDVKRGKGGLSAFGVLEASEEEMENYQYPEKLYKGKFSGMGKEAEDYGSPRARTQRASKFLTPEGMLNKGASPGARSVLDKDKFSHVRKKIQEVNQYLRDRLKACNLNVKKLAELTDLCETTIAHYFRTDDSGCALPSRDDWQTMSEYLNLGNYDDYIDGEWHSAIPQIHPLGKNPGDVIITESLNCKRYKTALYEVNENYFRDIYTEEQAYWLGFLWADGSIDNRGRLRLALQKGDLVHLVRFREAIGSTHPITYEEDNNAYRLEICSKTMIEDLKKIKFKGNLPNIPNHLIRHFIRGFFDGDGSIFENRVNEYGLSFTNANKDLLADIGQILSQAINCDERHILDDHNVYKIGFGGTDQVKGIRDFLYTNSNIYLERKFNKFPAGKVKWSFNPDFWEITLHGFHAVNGKHHFAVYPEEICIRPILSSSRKGDIVLDPFVGSGTTCLVAMQYKRRSIGIDLNPDYIQLAKNRIFSGLAEIEMFGGEDEENKHRENNRND